MLVSFEEWRQKNSAAYDLENQIIADKLALGTNGVEWLVLQKHVNEHDIKSMDVWLMNVQKFKKKELETVILDGFCTTPDDFYEKYQINWWISVDESLNYLSLLRQRRYDQYFDLITKLQHKEKC
ncbi:hypothetical protein [Paenibacillus massiliensis]|uniref:hypothetical protein n=1 Tax=Paenibacillus massiliensis TaxID=225917 RepID=UPI00047168A0|nr:hypothetical protein [Paenibacillus massiliensis]